MKNENACQLRYNINIVDAKYNPTGQGFMVSL